MDILKKYWFIILLFGFLIGSNVFQFCNPKIKDRVIKKIITKKDTTETLLLRAKEAEITYLKRQLNVKPKSFEILKLDTVYINDPNNPDAPEKFVVPNFIAKFDTSYNEGKDSVYVSYEYPKNRFDFLHRYTYSNSFTESTIIHEEKKLFEFSHGIIAGAFVDPLGQIRLGIGYGFQLKINY